MKTKKWVPLDPFPFAGTVISLDGTYWVCKGRTLQGYNPTWWAHYKKWIQIEVEEWIDVLIAEATQEKSDLK